MPQNLPGHLTKNVHKLVYTCILKTPRVTSRLTGILTVWFQTKLKKNPFNVIAECSAYYS